MLCSHDDDFWCCGGGGGGDGGVVVVVMMIVGVVVVVVVVVRSRCRFQRASQTTAPPMLTVPLASLTWWPSGTPSTRYTLPTTQTHSSCYSFVNERFGYSCHSVTFLSDLKNSLNRFKSK